LSSSAPKVSIVVTVYNNEQYLEKCLDSIVAQTLRDIEIILVNDGSTDGSLGILNRYAEADGRIVVIDKPNAGLGHTFNTGLDRATGKYIGYVETDDWIDADMFESLYALAEEHQADVARSNPYIYEGETDRSVPADELPLSETGLMACPRESTVVQNLSWRIWACLYLRSFLQENHIRMNETPGAQYQDLAFAFQVVAASDRMYLSPHSHYHYRVDNPNSSLHHETMGWQWVINELAFFEAWVETVFPGENRLVFFEAALFRLYRGSLLTMPKGKTRRDMIRMIQQKYKDAGEKGLLNRRYFTRDAWRYLNLLLRNRLLFGFSLSLYPVLRRIAGRHDEKMRPIWAG
jgi:glycosyltransferase involved in cell wall biosynthesis